MHASPLAGHGPVVPTVQTTTGKVIGSVNSKSPAVLQYLSIPFAQVPVGKLRFLPPQPLSQPEAIVNGTAPRYACMQTQPTTPNVYYTDVPEFLISSPVSEDCLTVSIWKPLAQSGPLPVIIWMYGGGHTSGGSDIPYQLPDQWIQRTQSHIVVSLQYRLTIFGFPNAAALPKMERNLGLLDQRAAVEWIYENIAAFGGNPSRMVLWGQSAGAVSTDWYNFAYPEDPLVGGFIMNSGTALLPLTNTDSNSTSFSKVAAGFNCTGTASHELECLRGVNSADIIAFLLNYGSTNSTAGKGGISFIPVADGRTVPSTKLLSLVADGVARPVVDFTTPALAGNFSKLPAIINTCEYEGIASIAYNTSGVNFTLARIHTNDYFQCPAMRTANNRFAVGAVTYRSIYNGNFSNISPRPWEVAYHDSELPMIFGTYNDFRGAGPRSQRELSEHMQDAYVAFAKDPTNGPKSMGWEPYVPEGVVRGWGMVNTTSAEIYPFKQTAIDKPCLVGNPGLAPDLDFW